MEIIDILSVMEQYYLMGGIYKKFNCAYFMQVVVYRLRHSYPKDMADEARRLLEYMDCYKRFHMDMFAIEVEDLKREWSYGCALDAFSEITVTYPSKHSNQVIGGADWDSLYV